MHRATSSSMNVFAFAVQITTAKSKVVHASMIARFPNFTNKGTQNMLLMLRKRKLSCAEFQHDLPAKREETIARPHRQQIVDLILGLVVLHLQYHRCYRETSSRKISAKVES